MTTGATDLAAFARLVEALRPWHSQMVIVGGWAHRLHRLLPGAAVPAYDPIRTLDADVAFSAAPRMEGNIAQALKTAGFTEELFAKHEPPVSSYSLPDAGGFYAEFLTPLLGGERRRDGSLDATAAVAGVTAQKLPYLDILLTAPVPIALPAHGDIPVEHAMQVRVAHPVCFIAQKLLIAHRRDENKRAQDILYVHDTIELFGARLTDLATTWRSRVRTTLHPRTIAAIEGSVAEQYADVTDDIRRAARIPQGRSLTPERLRATCALGLQRILLAE